MANARRSFVRLFTVALFCLSASIALAQAPISIVPKSVKAGTTATLTVTSTGFFDLTQITAAQFSVNPSAGVTNLQVSNASPQNLTLSFDVSSKASPGQRTLSIDANDVVLSLKLTVEAAVQACSASNCRPPRKCDNGVCITPVCSTINCHAPDFCDGDKCVRGCRPACRPPKRFCDNGTCTNEPPH